MNIRWKNENSLHREIVDIELAQGVAVADSNTEVSLFFTIENGSLGDNINIHQDTLTKLDKIFAENTLTILIFDIFSEEDELVLKGYVVKRLRKDNNNCLLECLKIPTDLVRQTYLECASESDLEHVIFS